ncbi:ShlB/FhaC/HecB family hemolysin secretion/activation protein [Lactiplantibacillus plantarum]|uniref:ShlB/FhaC/HecB family hemolysin secretion/activation protein n=1 Tax=Lactiplantibacillus plantarum TaxID=1590 RepID=UPI004045E9D7
MMEMLNNLAFGFEHALTLQNLMYCAIGCVVGTLVGLLQLTLRYVPGRISGVKSEGAPGWWRTALPTWPGGEVNQRDLDQALENIRRLAGQADASIDVAPGPELGDSDIIIKPGTGKRWHAYVGGDNAGMESTGKNQVNAGLTLDSPLFLYDQLSVSWNSNADLRNSDAGSRAASINSLIGSMIQMRTNDLSD